MEWRDGAWTGTYGIGETLFFHALREGDDRPYRAHVPVIGPKPDTGDPRSALFMITGMEARHIADLRRGDMVLPLSETRVMIICGNCGDNPPYAVVDGDGGALLATGQLPMWSSGLSDSIYALSEAEIIYVQPKIRPHPTHADLKEQVAWLIRFNVHTGEWAEAELDGLHDDYVQNMAYLRNQPPDRHRIRSFDGFISFEAGHDDWIVLNYLTSQSGKHDLVWFWNSRTDEIIKIKPSDFPRREPTFRYEAALDRYLAIEYGRVDLLIPFDEFTEGREVSQLKWNR